MPLDINTGYNETFKAFTVFATKSLEAGKTKAIARTDGPIGILVMFDELGGEEMLGMKMFVGGLVAGRCGEASLRAIQGALKSTTAGQLYACYADLKKNEIRQRRHPDGNRDGSRPPDGR